MVVVFTAQIGLSFNDLSGTLPTELGNCTSITGSINLDINSLTGPIPSELGRLTNMKELLLVDNQLTGTVPSEVCSLPTLIFFEGNLGLNGCR